MRRVLVLAFALLGVGWTLPAATLAQDNSAIDEYIESVPGAGGDNPSNVEGGGGAGGGNDGGSGDAGTGASLPQSNADALEAQGNAGAAAANLAESTAPDNATRDSGVDGSQSGSGEGVTGDSGRDLPSVGDVVSGVSGRSDSDGLGVWLLVILGTTLVAAIALGLARRRRGPGEPTQA